MFTRTSTAVLPLTAAFSALLLLAGCGGGSEPAVSPDAPLEHTHEHGLDDDHPTTAAGLPAPFPMAAESMPDQVLPAPEPLAFVESIKLATTFSPLVNSTINALPYWPVWYGTGKPVDGVNCLISGAVHKHALISIYKDGKRLGFPDGIGRVHAGCYHAYELHVHDVTGIIHMETNVPKNFKLGQWFSLWQQPLTRDAVAGLVGPVRYYIIENGTITRYDAVPYDIALLPHREVLIVTGTQMFVAPKYQWPLGI